MSEAIRVTLAFKLRNCKVKKSESKELIDFYLGGRKAKSTAPQDQNELMLVNSEGFLYGYDILQNYTNYLLIFAGFQKNVLK